MHWWIKSLGALSFQKFYLCTLAWCKSTPYIESFLAFSRKFTSASAGLIPLQHKCHTINHFFHIHTTNQKYQYVSLSSWHSMYLFSLTYSYGAVPSLSPLAHVSGWVQSESRWHSQDHVPLARSLQVRPGQCRSPEGRGWQMSKADDRTGCRLSAAGTDST